jgi:hypothetical protein
VAFPDDVRIEILLACKRCCAICHNFCGLKIELHHIRLASEGGTDTYENCIPLCFNCHADMRSYDHKHPKGTKYTAKELLRHRDAWFESVRTVGGPALEPEYAAADRSMLDEIRHILPWDRSVVFLREHNFAYEFSAQSLTVFDEFCDRCKDPAFEFFDADLEAHRSQFISALNRFLSNVGQYTSGQSAGCLGVGRQWTHADRPRFDREVESLQDSASDAANQYDALIRVAKRKLAAR